MLTAFTKMHGLGNDFVVFDNLDRRLQLRAPQVRALADRRFGVGCDQVLLVEPPTRADIDFAYRIFNADGGEVEQCGNGARCFVRFVHDKGLTRKTEIAVETLSGVIYPRLETTGEVSVNMGVPQFNPAQVPFDADSAQAVYTLDVNGEDVAIGVVSMGNPHAVQIVDDVERAPIAAQGPAIERHPRFPQRVNAGYMQIVARDRIRLRVYERGAGETLACGTGACAAVAIGRNRKLLDSRVQVELRGGNLTIEWPAPDRPLRMTGPAQTVYEGQIDLARL